MLYQVSCNRSSQHNNHDIHCLDMLCSQVSLCNSFAALPHCMVPHHRLIIQSKHLMSFTPLAMDHTAQHPSNCILARAIICWNQNHGEQRRPQRR